MRILKKPKVYLVARPQIVEDGLQSFLADQNLAWPTPIEGVRDAERLVEVAGRCCYMSFGKKAGSKTNVKYIQNLLGRNNDGTFKPGPAHGSVCEHPCWSFLIVGAGRGFCYDEQTEVLTNEGWKFWGDIRGDEKFATLNVATDTLEYQLSTKITREWYDGTMFYVKSKMVNLLVTPNHRMLYSTPENKKWRFATASELDLKKRYKCKRNVVNWHGEEVNEIHIPSFTSGQVVSNQYGSYGSKEIICKGLQLPAKPFARFLGYWLAEGSLDHSNGSGWSVVISQNEDSECYNDILKTITELGLSYSIHRCGIRNCKQIKTGNRSLYEYLKPYHGAINKGIPPEIKNWSSELLSEIIEAHLDGDGSFGNRGSGEANTISKRLSDDLQEIALKTGISATVRKIDRRHEPPRMLNGKRVSHKNICYVVSYCRKRNEPLLNHNGKQSISHVQYSGDIYCATVPNGTLYVRRNGRPVWSGNSHEQVRHRTGWAYSQLSTRYCDFEREEEEGTWEPGFCIPALGQLQDSTASAFVKQLERSQQVYVELLHHIEDDLKGNQAFMDSLASYDEKERSRMLRKAARGAARDILPIATEAIMVMSANARAIWNCIVLRANEHAEAVIRDIYVQIAKIMETEMPALYTGIRYEKCWDGSEVVFMPRDKL